MTPSNWYRLWNLVMVIVALGMFFMEISKGNPVETIICAALISKCIEVDGLVKIIERNK